MFFDSIGGFDSEFWPGEDTKLCLEIIKKGKIIVYDPTIRVYHHRRKGWKNYVRQVFRYSMHRGYFLKKLGGNSLRIAYFVPSFFLLGLIGGLILSFFNQLFLWTYLAILLVYITLVLAAAISSQKLSAIPLFFAIMFVTHVVYGAGFMRGLAGKNIQSKLKPAGEE